MSRHPIETTTILTGLDRQDAGKLFSMAGESRTRENGVKIRSKPCKTVTKRYLFSQRMMNLWGSLKQKAAEAKSPKIFQE